MNRTIEIDCHAEHMFDDPKLVATTLYSNYGFAGKEFVSRLMEDGAFERVQALQNDMQEHLKTGDTMDKQTASAALILAADRLTEELIFQDGILLRPEDIQPYLVSKETVNQNGRAFNTSMILSISINPGSARTQTGRARYGAALMMIMSILFGLNSIRLCLKKDTMPPHF